MPCYFRRIKSVLAEAGIEATPASKRQIDQAIHRLMGVDYKDCPRYMEEAQARDTAR